FGVGGGMLTVRNPSGLLLITHPGGAKSFDYGDRWDGSALIYTGRGKTGNQKFEGPNRSVGENSKQLIVLEGAGPRRLRYVGVPTCAGCWTSREPDTNGVDREVFKFKLLFSDVVAPSPASVIAPTEPSRTRKE